MRYKQGVMGTVGGRVRGNRREGKRAVWATTWGSETTECTRSRTRNEGNRLVSTTGASATTNTAIAKLSQPPYQGTGTWVFRRSHLVLETGWDWLGRYQLGF